MQRLVVALREFLVAAVDAGGNQAATAKFTLQNVDWKQTLTPPEPSTHPVANTYLESACIDSGPSVSSRREVITTLLSNSNQLTWRPSSKCREVGPDIELLLQNFAVATVIGAGGPLQSDQVYAGFSLQAPNTYYPPHAHDAEETYWVIGGNGDWRVDSKSWFAVQPGSSIYHKPLTHHAMQTNEQAMLSIWLWTSDLDSEVLIIRG